MLATLKIRKIGMEEKPLFFVLYLIYIYNNLLKYDTLGVFEDEKGIKRVRVCHFWVFAGGVRLPVWLCVSYCVRLRVVVCHVV